MAHKPFRGRHSVFWRVAAALIAVQLATGLLATGFSAYLASDRSVELAANSLRVRMDALAEEIERSGSPLDSGLENLPGTVMSNLSFRFPDPLVLVDSLGRELARVYPDPGAFEIIVADSTIRPDIPTSVADVLAAGAVQVDTGDDTVAGGWAAAPLYDASGILVGGYVIQPIERTIARELAPTREAFRTALWSVIVVSVALAVLLAAVFTWWLVRPLRWITARVVEIGAGDYTSRVSVRGTDEIAQLGTTVNQMAEKVATSVEALKSTDRMRRELIANIGHDLRTPMAALRGYVEEGLRFMSENRDREGVRAVESARRQAEYLQRLVDDLFELSLLENPSPILRTESVPVAELLHDAFDNHAARMAAGGIRFSMDIDGSLPVIEADGVRLMRIMDNLLSNALRHTNPGDSVRMAAKQGESTVEIEVTDTGEGMSSESLERIFDRYYRGEASRTRDEHGTGLGLAISRAVAELHGGELTATSHPGEGTVMHLTLPLALPPVRPRNPKKMDPATE